jgi:glycosyltransferase involved in cell wall biosynthesis
LKKVTYLISNINKAIAFEWIAQHFPNHNLQLSFVLLNTGPSELESSLKNNNVRVTRIHFAGSRHLVKAFFKLYGLLRETKPDIVHCHLFHATLLGLFTGRLAGVKRCIYTRHHSTYNWQYNKKGVWLDRLLNWLATDIVAISENVRNVLLNNEKVPSAKVRLIQHGFDLYAFQSISNDRIENLKKKYNPHNRAPAIGVIARWLHLKGLQYIIPAFQQVLADYPNAFIILANANGPYKEEIDSMLASLPEHSHISIPFENDLFALYQLFDVYVHTPLNPTIEAFGQTYVEALAAGIPSIFTMSGVAPEFVEHEKNAMVVDFKDQNGIYNSVSRLLADKDLSERMVKNGKRDVQRFELGNMISKLEKLYECQVRR